LDLAMKRVEALEAEIQELRDEQEYYLNEYEQERERAGVAERQAQASTFRIQQLTDQLRAKGDQPDEGDTLPSSWPELQDWCDQKLAGRLVISAVARRNSKNPQFQDVEQVARCLLWLANTCREGRMSGAGTTLREAPVEDGIRNSPCGSDTYEFDWNGRRLSADWHIKNGGNTRDPARCLRIYYCFDDQTQQIIVSDMPAHRRTGAT
ncbi:MAG: hypothetical protein KC594_19070, partial [Nitrospira sp.]|nr:hypothetical protein [Nitrospira sp.]